MEGGEGSKGGRKWREKRKEGEGSKGGREGGKEGRKKEGRRGKEEKGGRKGRKGRKKRGAREGRKEGITLLKPFKSNPWKGVEGVRRPVKGPLKPPDPDPVGTKRLLEAATSPAWPFPLQRREESGSYGLSFPLLPSKLSLQGHDNDQRQRPKKPASQRTQFLESNAQKPHYIRERRKAEEGGKRKESQWRSVVPRKSYVCCEPSPKIIIIIIIIITLRSNKLNQTFFFFLFAKVGNQKIPWNGWIPSPCSQRGPCLSVDNGGGPAPTETEGPLPTKGAQGPFRDKLPN
ncbi:hypothetical protein E2320_022456, partial [Naja naja]